jgi:catechol 2,3-dioxygenase-like lactoylglutathione lyase family enzyme
MAVRRLDHVGVVVEDLAAAIAFLEELGLAVEGEMPVGGEWVDGSSGSPA